ncbi:hypothetical protein OG342_05235 [Streptomyces bobili]|uniref:hypothetical protein n=1 Tax=Streptomyces bobili TaxID=67280 RepID=UPI002256E8F5|nr:hypothetical protein [Streptomyces bobili]MCX5522272.1 hypothetical protein [Streptomyces bobili]
MASEADEPREASKKPEFDMEMVPTLPGGRAVHPAEQEGRFVWLIAEGAMTKQCFDEMREYLRYIVDNDLWIQNWDGKPPPDSTAG